MLTVVKAETAACSLKVDGDIGDHHRRRPQNNEAAVAQGRQRRDPLLAVKPDCAWGRPGREGQEGDTVQGEQLGVVITEKRNRCREN